MGLNARSYQEYLCATCSHARTCAHALFFDAFKADLLQKLHPFGVDCFDRHHSLLARACAHAVFSTRRKLICFCKHPLAGFTFTVEETRVPARACAHAWFLQHQSCFVTAGGVFALFPSSASCWEIHLQSPSSFAVFTLRHASRETGSRSLRSGHIVPEWSQEAQLGPEWSRNSTLCQIGCRSSRLDTHRRGPFKHFA